MRSTASVFVAWSSPDTLLLRPEYAWLSLPDVIFVRLPTALDDLCERLKLGSRSRDHKQESERLFTTLGQWQWALGELRGALELGNIAEAHVRVGYLRSFSSKHWPGWYEEVLAGLRVAIDAQQSIVNTISVLISEAADIATIEACSPILSWIERPEELKRATLFLDTLCYAGQELVPISTVVKCVANDHWWNEFDTSLSAAAESVAGLHCPEDTLAPTVIEVLTSLSGPLAKIKHFEKLAPYASLAEIRDGYAAADTLVRLIHDLMVVKIRSRSAFLSAYRDSRALNRMTV